VNRRARLHLQGFPKANQTSFSGSRLLHGHPSDAVKFPEARLLIALNVLYYSPGGASRNYFFGVSF